MVTARAQPIRPGGRKGADQFSDSSSLASHYPKLTPDFTRSFTEVAPDIFIFASISIADYGWESD
jgi:hypothetical protein